MLRWNEGKSAHGCGKRKSPRPRRGKTPVCRPANGLALANGRQQPQTLLMPSRSAAPGADSQGLQSHQWSHARPTPFTASRYPRHPAAHVAPPEASPHRAAEPAPPTTLPKVINKGAAPRPPRPWHQHEADPGAQKTEIRPKLQLFCDCGLPQASKRGLKPGKTANRTHSGPFPPRGGRKGVLNRKKVAQKSEFLFLRNGSSQRSNSCERHVCLQCQSGRAAARNHRASTMQALMPSPLAKIPRWLD